MSRKGGQSTLECITDEKRMRHLETELQYRYTYSEYISPSYALNCFYSFPPYSPDGDEFLRSFIHQSLISQLIDCNRRSDQLLTRCEIGVGEL